MARINLLDLLPGERRGVNTACAEAVWKHNVSVYRKNINTSSPLWVIDGGTGEGQPGAGRVTGACRRDGPNGDEPQGRVVRAGGA